MTISSTEEIPVGAVAIIGMAGRFPGAADLTQFWQNLAGGVEAISRFTDEELLAEGIDPLLLQHPHYIKAGGVLADADKFAASFFGFSPREAEIMAPQHRLFLECAWEALEDGGYIGESYPGKIGVFGGMNFNSYLLTNLYSHPDLIERLGGNQLLLANAEDFLCTRTSYKLNLKGPSFTVQTACSTGLVAATLAYFSLLNYQSDMALAGGVTVGSPLKAGYLYQEGGVASPDGHTRTFDARAQGCVLGNGVGLVLLKRLQDALDDGDHIYAVIRGAAMNNDGSMKVGYTAPSVEAQTEVILMAQSLADVDPATISYIEAHGTATALGDPIEVAALTRAFRQRTDQRGYCALGSVKTNVGHLDTAAGTVGLIKTVLALHHQQIPPSLHYESPNPQIDFESSPFFVNQQLRPWEANVTPRRAGVNSLGMGGTNAHVVLEEAPRRPPRPALRPLYPLILSAQEPTTLAAAATRLADHLDAHPDLPLADVANTLMVGRKPFSARRVLLAATTEEASRLLRAPGEQAPLWSEAAPAERPVAFLFPAGAALVPNAGRSLYESEAPFREAVEQCAALLEESRGLPLREVLYPDAGQEAEAQALLSEPWVALPARFAFSYALARLWLAHGAEPQALLGEGIGELVAATVAGVFTVADALALVAALGEALNEIPTGQRLRVPLTPVELSPLLGDELAVSALRTATECIVSGPEEAIAQLEATLTEQDIAVARLPADMLDALHAPDAPRMTPLLAAFWEQLASAERLPPRIRLWSSGAGDWLKDEAAQDPDPWAALLRAPARLAEGLAALPNALLLEVGPGTDLTTLAQRSARAPLTLASLPRAEGEEYRGFLESWARLWLGGVALDRHAFFAHEPRYRLPLPTYPFVRERYWLEPQPETGRPMASQAPDALAPSLEPLPDYPDAPRTPLERYLARLWSQFLGEPQIGVHDNFYDLGGDSLLSLQLVSQIQDAGFQLTMSKFLELQTIAALAELLGGQGVVLEEEAVPTPQEPPPAPESESPPAAPVRPALPAPSERLVRLQAGDEGVPPLFLVPPANANLFPYRRLTAHLDPSRPVYTLVPQPERLLRARTLLDVANDYLDAIRSVQPRGPYHLVGWSAGGPFAYELAQQFRQRREPIHLLCLIDSGLGENVLAFTQLTSGMVQASPPFAALYRAGGAGQALLRGMAHALLRYRGEDVRAQLEPYNRVAALMPYVRWLEETHGVTLDVTPEKLFPLTLAEQQAHLRAQVVQHGLEVDDAVWASIEQWVALTLKMSALMDGYAPDPFPGRLTYLRAIEPLPDEPELIWADHSDETRGAAAHCHALTLHRVAGNHLTMMEEPYVRIVAAKLNDALREAAAHPAWVQGLSLPAPSRRLSGGWLLFLLLLAASLAWLAFQVLS